ncbi:MAG: hypothetical protein D6730_02215 [Bacteroidetes bacterium]|nr:MAG: hypothetical protein D6730_02215 [Bacteroidota bacterium]
MCAFEYIVAIAKKNLISIEQFFLFFLLTPDYQSIKIIFVTIQHPQGEKKNNCCKLLIFNEMY